MAIYYIDTVSFDLATAVWAENTLTTKAPDGFYSFGGDYRQQVGGLLGTTIPCLTCLDCVPGDMTIGTQVWSKCNLNVDTYANGDPIPQVTDPTLWNSLTTGAWCYYNNDPANGAIYGKLYNGHAINDPRGLAPVGYHIPTDAEWTTLTDYLGGATVAGGKMKEEGLCHWLTPNQDATDACGFAALPGGCRGDFGNFVRIGTNGDWWSSTQDGLGFNYIRYISYLNGNSNSGLYVPYYGFSVRVIANAPGSIPLDWSFSEINGTGEMILYVNEVPVVTRNVTDLGTYIVNVGDEIRVSVSTQSCSPPNIKAVSVSTGIITGDACADASVTYDSATYFVTSMDLGTTLSLDTYSQCSNICLV
jgi:uncharacterized protein (TIGR02145 family)